MYALSNATSFAKAVVISLGFFSLYPLCAYGGPVITFTDYDQGTSGLNYVDAAITGGTNSGTSGCPGSTCTVSFDTLMGIGSGGPVAVNFFQPGTNLTTQRDAAHLSDTFVISPFGPPTTEATWTHNSGGSLQPILSGVTDLVEPADGVLTIFSTPSYLQDDGSIDRVTYQYITYHDILQSVPEPSTILLMVVALTAMGVAAIRNGRAP